MTTAKITSRAKKLPKIVFLNFILKNKINNKPNINKVNGILFPESRIPKPKIHTANTVARNLKLFLCLKEKATKKIAKKENFCKKPPAINSSPKKLELWTPTLLKPTILTPKLY